MGAISKFLEEKLLPIGEKIENVKFLRVIRESMIPTTPFIIAGSVALIVLNFPYINDVVPLVIMDALRDVLVPIFNATMSIVALFISYLIGYNYAKNSGNNTTHVFSGLTTLGIFILMIPKSIIQEGIEIGGVIPMSYLGATGIFVALIVSYAAAFVFNALDKSKFKIILPSGVPPMVVNSFGSIIPIFATFLVGSLVNVGLGMTTYNNIFNFVNVVLQQPLLKIGTGLPAMLLAQALVQVLWFFGLHGDNIVGSIFDPVWTTAGLENLSAFENNQPLPYIITQQFISLFVVIGFMSLVIAILITAKSSRLKQTSKLTGVPAVFCISEPLVFGLPVVFNVSLFIPWVLVRPLFGLVTYLAMRFNLVPAPTGVTIPWTTPPVLSGILATNSIMGGILQVVLLVLGTLLFIPFVKMLDNQYVVEEKEERGLES